MRMIVDSTQSVWTAEQNVIAVSRPIALAHYRLKLTRLLDIM